MKKPKSALYDFLGSLGALVIIIVSIILIGDSVEFSVRVVLYILALVVSVLSIPGITEFVAPKINVRERLGNSESESSPFEKDEKMQDTLFPQNEVTMQEPPFRVPFLARGKSIALYPNSYAVAVSAKGNPYNLKGGFTPLPAGQYALYYIDKRERIGEVPKISDRTQDDIVLSLSATITYRVVNPIEILEMERPIKVLFLLVQRGVKEFINANTYYEVMGPESDYKVGLATFIGKQVSAHHKISKCLAVTNVVIREKEGDPKLMEFNKNIRIQEKQSNADKYLLELNQEINRIKLHHELETIQIRAEAKVREHRILREIEPQKSDIKKASSDSNDWELSPTVAAYSSYPNNLLRVQIPLPELIASNEFFGNIAEKVRAIEFLYAVFTIISLGTAKVIDDFTRLLRSKTEVTNELVNSFLSTVQVEPLRIAKIHYGSPVAIDLLGISSSLEALRETIKDLSWRGKHEKLMAELDRKRKQLEIQEQRLKVENLVISQRQQNEKTALEIKKQQADIKRAWVEILSQEIELQKKISDLTPEQEEIITSFIVSKGSPLINNPITPLLKNEVDNKDDKVEKLTSTLLDLLKKNDSS